MGTHLGTEVHTNDDDDDDANALDAQADMQKWLGRKGLLVRTAEGGAAAGLFMSLVLFPHLLLPLLCLFLLQLGTRSSAFPETAINIHRECETCPELLIEKEEIRQTSKWRN